MTGHVPIAATDSCEICHVGPGSSVTGTVQNTSKFSGSRMNHAGITTCNSCHAAGTGPFVGVSKIIQLPPTSPAGAGSHIPSGATDCATCHMATMPTGLIAASATTSAPGTLFQTPAPSTSQIHTGISGNCSSCHDTGHVWMGMSQAAYQINPKTLSASSTTQYTGFNTRPVAAGGTYSIADPAHPATGDCVSCHGTNTNYFSGQAEPAGHIPTLGGASCANCHTTPGNFALYDNSPAGLTRLHTQVTSSCSTCHADVTNPPIFTGAPGFAIVRMSTRGPHIPITNGGAPVECSGCHKSVTSFAGTIMSHAAIGDSGVSAAGNACDACHEGGFGGRFFGIQINFTRKDSQHYICGAPGTPNAPNTTNCGGGGSDCLNGCHQHNNIPNTYKRAPRQGPAKSAPVAPATAAAPAAPGASRHGGSGAVGADPQAAAPGGPFDHAAAVGKACQSCHNGVAASGRGPTHAKTTAACGDCHSTLRWTPVLRVDHAQVLGNCASCHNGKAATGKTAKHPLSGNDCDRCHTTSAWKPAAFDHGAVLQGTCATCHDGLQATGKSAKHVVTQLACDSCHYVLGWTQIKPQRPATRKPVPIMAPALPPRLQIPPQRGRGQPLALRPPAPPQ